MDSENELKKLFTKGSQKQRIFLLNLGVKERSIWNTVAKMWSKSLNLQDLGSNSWKASYHSRQLSLNEIQNIFTMAPKAFIYNQVIQKELSIHCVKSVQIRSFFFSVFSRIRTEYWEILHISPCSVRMWENKDQKRLCIWTLFTQW